MNNYMSYSLKRSHYEGRQDVIGDLNELVLDLKDLEYTSSAGMRVLLSAQRIMNSQGSMKVINVRSEIMDIFEITGFNQILTIE